MLGDRKQAVQAKGVAKKKNDVAKMNFRVIKNINKHKIKSNTEVDGNTPNSSRQLSESNSDKEVLKVTKI